MSDLLSIGTSALQAYQRTLATVGHNIANASTAGYTRQQVQLVSQAGSASGAGFIGAGVGIAQIQRLADGYSTERLRFDAASQAQAERLQVMTQRVDGLLSDGRLGLNEALTRFYSSLEAAAAAPLSAAARQSVLSAAQTLSDRFQGLQHEFEGLQAEVGERLSLAAEHANALTGAIADLNDRIALEAGRTGGQAPNDLLDRRDQLLEQLAAQIGITTTLQDDGAVNVFSMDGQALVLGTHTREIHVTADVYRSDHWQLTVGEGAGAVPITASVQGGTIGGLMEFQRLVMDPAMGDLGRIATGLAMSVNTQHAQGVDLLGQFGTDLFEVPTVSVHQHPANSGGAAVSVAFDDPGAVSGKNYLLRHDGVAWTLFESSSGSPVSWTGSGTVADPFVAAGLRITVSGVPANQDRFLIVPTEHAAGDLAVAITDPSRLAVASAVMGDSATTNRGSGRIDTLHVMDAGDPSLRSPVTIEFVSANSYTLDGSGPFAYVEGAAIDFNGWRLKLSGQPSIGDTFRVVPTPPGSGDNRNAQALAGLRTRGVLDGGNQSLSEGYSNLVVRTGVHAQQATQRFEAQSALSAQARADRDRTSGVNLDEEAANLVRFQQAYQAAAQAIAVADSVFQSLLAAVRR